MGGVAGDAVRAARTPPPANRLNGRVVAVVGPTATGKSALGLDLAQRIDGEVVNADSMQLYEGMDIGTAKLRADERGGVTHHLLDVWAVTRTASVADYQRMARAVIDDVLRRGRVPVLVGGSGLYVRAALDRMDFPGTDAQLRADLEGELGRRGPAALHARLASADPAAAAAILPSNGRRIVRALEVIALTGRPFTAALPGFEAVYDVVQVGLDLPDDQLDRRVDRRVDEMFAAGLVDEVRALDQVGLRQGRTAARALGYAQVLALLDGQLTDAEAVASTAQATRRFVRRQRSWFRRDPRIHWVASPSYDAALDVLLRAMD
jgi:tRNA dimethylallyltransferase